MAKVKYITLSDAVELLRSAQLKETGGKGRFIATGVRWAESAKRKNRGILEQICRQE